MHLHFAQWNDSHTPTTQHLHICTSAHLHVCLLKLCLSLCQYCTMFDQPSHVHMCALFMFMPVIRCGPAALVVRCLVRDSIKNSLSPSIDEMGHKTMTPSRIPVRSNPSKRSTPVQIEVSSSISTSSPSSLPTPPPPPTTTTIDHIPNNNDNKSKSTHPVSPLELQAIQ